ncbi:MAG: hypothetical protein H2041_13210 [Phenylobacterium sp.]|uniref:hypothetical protein n=1 Tax=Phenylobacterium sp. TaxID=1871053 RepID=UPI0017C7CEC6|nr:hypothetical protein [Phenylobacterium sp.]MBA4794618.1 hypothetical protein [Phenylobacterium sp.]
MSRARVTVLALAGLLATTTVALCVALLISQAPSRRGEAPIRLAVAENTAANRALGLTPPDFAAARSATWRALRQSPYDPSAWLRLAYIDAAEDGRLDKDGAAAFTRSYELLPFDQYVAVWRVGFALENWQSLTPETRARVRAEALAFARTSRYREMRTTLLGVTNPVGRLPGVLWAQRMREERAARLNLGAK